jgi:hypothetical protein
MPHRIGRHMAVIALKTSRFDDIPHLARRLLLS